MITGIIGTVNSCRGREQQALTLTLSRRERGQKALTSSQWEKGQKALTLSQRTRGLLASWLALALLLVAAGWASTAAAQDDDGSAKPRWRARTTARQYPDDEVPSGNATQQASGPVFADQSATGAGQRPSRTAAASRKVRTVAASSDAPALDLPAPVRRRIAFQQACQAGPSQSARRSHGSRHDRFQAGDAARASRLAQHEPRLPCAASIRKKDRR